MMVPGHVDVSHVELGLDFGLPLHALVVHRVDEGLLHGGRAAGPLVLRAVDALLPSQVLAVL